MNSVQNHTPALPPPPWSVVPVGVRTHWSDIVDANGRIIAQVVNIHGTACEIQTGRMLAAAPDLLAACEAALAYLETTRPTDVKKNYHQMVRHEHDAVRPLRAALTRAKGGAQ